MMPFRSAAIALLLLSAAPALADAPASKPAAAKPAKPKAMPREIMAEPRLTSVALRTGDLARSLKFYTSALGMVENGRLELPQVTEVFLGFTADMKAPGLMLIVPKATDAAAPIAQGNGYVRTVIRIGSAKLAEERILAAGYVPERTASHAAASGTYKIVMVRDPDGYLYELVEYPREVKK